MAASQDYTQSPEDLIYIWDHNMTDSVKVAIYTISHFNEFNDMDMYIL